MRWSTIIHSVIVCLSISLLLADQDVALSQITIDSTDFQSVILNTQRSIIRIEYNPNPLIDLGTTSPVAQTFDFSSVPNEDSRDSGIQHILDPTAQPGSVFFPGATHCSPLVTHPTDSSEITHVSYFRLQYDGFYLMGHYIRQTFSTTFDTTVVQRFIPMRLTIPLPLEYGISRSGRDTIFTDSVNNDYIVSSTSIECDGWGDLTLPAPSGFVPFGTTSAVAALRMTHTRTDDSYSDGIFSDRVKWVSVEYVMADGSMLSVNQTDSDYVDGTAAVEIIEYTLPDYASAALSVASDLPGDFALLQNYPNPFNPGTSFTFMLPVSVHVRLSVYDIIGREVATVIDREMTPGSYVVPFDAANLTSGVYICRLAAGGAVLVNKMNIVR